MNFDITSQELRGSVKKDVPFLKGAWVEFWDDVTSGDIKKAQSTDQGDIQSGQELMLTQIKEWNFAEKVDGKEVVLPLSVASLDRLPTKLQTWIAQVQTELLAEQAKKKEENVQKTDSST